MRYAFSLLCVAAIASACTQQPPAQTSSTVTLTAADVDDATIGDLSERLATALCKREVACQRAPSADDCRGPKLSRSRAELASWRCSPAAARARAKECLTAIGTEPCALGDLTARPFMCGGNEMCPASPAGRQPLPAGLTAP